MVWLIVLAVALWAGATYLAWPVVSRWVNDYRTRRLTRPTIIIHTTENTSFRGLLMEQSRDGYTLLEPEHLDSQTALDGRSFIPREKVHHIQFGVAAVALPE